MAHVLSEAGQENIPQSERPAKMQKVEALLVKKLSEDATLPTRGSSGAAGYDLSRQVTLLHPRRSWLPRSGAKLADMHMSDCSAHDTVIPAKGRGLVKTDLSIAIPTGTYARVAPRSGLAVKHGIDVGAGVVDEDYRGPLGVVLFNFGDSDFQGGQRCRLCYFMHVVTNWFFSFLRMSGSTPQSVSVRLMLG